jgi:glycerophosphoryl diester phosphodiesterase
MKTYIDEIKTSISMFKNNIKQTLIFELVFNAISIGTIYLLNKFIFSISFKINHIEYLSNATVWPWLRSPFTIIILFISFFIWLFMSIIEISAMIRNYNSRTKISCWQMFYSGIKDAKRIFNEKSTRLIWYIVVIIPAIGSIGAFNINKSVFIPEYISVFINTRPILWTLMIIGFTILYIYSIKWTYTLFYFQLKKENIKASIKDTNKKMRSLIFHTLIGKLLLLFFIVSLLVIFGALLIGLLILIFKIVLNNILAYQMSINICFWIPTIIKYFSQLLIVPLTISYVATVFKDNNHFINHLNYHDTLTLSSSKIKKVGLITIILALFVNILIVYSAGKEAYTNLRKADYVPAITAHRGSSDSAPENTIPAFDQAIVDKADWIELDVHQTKDGVLVISHDANLKRTTGKKQFIYNLTYDELEKLDVGSSFSSDFSNTHIPTLEEVLKRYQGKVKLNIELKPTGHEKNYVQDVIDLIKKYNFEDNCMVASMNETTLKEVKSTDPNITILYNMMVAEGDISKLSYIDNYSVEQSYITDSLIASVHKQNKEIFAFTVNDPDTIRKLADMGVDNIISDNPTLVRNILVHDRLAEKFFFLKYIFKIA